MAAARGVVEEKRLLAIFHLPDEIDTVVHPVLIEFFDIGKVDQLDGFALLRVARATMHFIVVLKGASCIIRKRDGLSATSGLKYSSRHSVYSSDTPRKPR